MTALSRRRESPRTPGSLSFADQTSRKERKTHSKHKESKCNYTCTVTSIQMQESPYLTSSSSLVGDWPRAMTASRSDFSTLLAAAERDDAGGFEHTIREICQQPPTWAE